MSKEYEVFQLSKRHLKKTHQKLLSCYIFWCYSK